MSLGIIVLILQRKMDSMKEKLFLGIVCCLMLGSCAQEYNAVYKSSDNTYKYEYAKECYAKGQYSRAVSLLDGLVSFQKGKDSGEECLYMYAMAQYNDQDYEGAAMAFRKYFSTYPKGKYAELAGFYIGESLYMNTPEPRLDQTDTWNAISAFQNFLDVFPYTDMKEKAQNRLFELQDKLVLKELHNAQLYFDMGHYFGNCNGGGDNNFEACVITAQNAMKDYPYNDHREEFALLIVKGKYELANMSIESKQVERFQDAEDEAYGFINEYPDSKDKSTVEKYIAHCKRYTEKAPADNN